MKKSQKNQLFHSQQLYNWIIDLQIPLHIRKQSAEQLQNLRRRFEIANVQYPTRDQIEQNPEHRRKERKGKIELGSSLEQLGICIHHCSGVSFGYSWVAWEKIYNVQEDISVLLFSVLREVMSRIGLISLIYPISSKRLFWMEFEFCHFLVSTIEPFVKSEENSITSCLSLTEEEATIKHLQWIQLCPSKNAISTEEDYLTSIKEWYQSRNLEGSRRIDSSNLDIFDQLGFWEQNEEIWVCWSSFVGGVFGDVSGHIVRECIWEILQRHQKAANKRLRWDQIIKIDVIYASLYPPNHPLQKEEIQNLKNDIIELILLHQPEFRQGISYIQSLKSQPNIENAIKHLFNKIFITAQNHPETWSTMLRSFPKAFRTIQYQDLPILQRYQRFQGVISTFQFRNRSEQYNNIFEMWRGFLHDMKDGLHERKECKNLLKRPQKIHLHVQEASLLLPTEVQLYTTRGGRWPSSKKHI
jgi:hypothetical protein